ncbi:ABC transporter ATP-binding protein [Streptomyces sp. TS71-3]|uniref:ABC transporter ATP-binding protein n=1 Tax=Streptomyces sp. TS71-3 TaxID=2733862 RepID=UPI001B1E6E0A|nr:ABC transporter ATP-binding protein [Streptomyces sp. TS71-3]GHJ38702.1 nitrate ABC transporter ATP-binding protein [Streptomyces sp. TS71-3]
MQTENARPGPEGTTTTLTDPAPEDHAVRFDDVSLVFHSRRNSSPVQALHEVSFDVREREFCAIVGPSGCGKSTLLNLVAGLTRPSSGRIQVHGRTVTGLVPDIGYVTQDSNLLPWLTVDGNIRLPLQIRKVPAEDQDRLVDKWIELVGLGQFRTSYPHQLSGGMQKRCSIARTLVYDPPILLMDEPFGALDAMTKAVMQDTLLDIWDAHQKTVLFVTHDLSEALTLADRVIVMSRRPGRVKAASPVGIPRPRDVFHISELREFAEQHRVLWDMFAAEISMGGLPK